MNAKLTKLTFMVLAMIFSISLSSASPTPVLTVQCDGAPVRCSGGSDGSAGVNVTGGVSPFTYVWSGPGGYSSTNQFNTGLTAGMYCVTVTSTLGNTATCCYNVVQPNPIVITTTNVNPSPCGSDGTIIVAGTGGLQPYQFSIDGGVSFQQQGTFINLACGTYTIEIHDGTGCTATTTDVLPCANISIIDSGCCLYVRPAGVFTYIWSDGSTTANICPLAPGQFSVTVISSAGCQLSASFFFPGCCHLVCHDTSLCFQTLDSSVAFIPPHFSDTTCTAVTFWHRFMGNNNHYVIGLNHVMWYARQPDGTLDSCTQNVIMNAPAPASINLSNTSPTIVGGVINICLHGTVYFSTIGSINVGLWSWDFGDGFYSNGVNPAHQYNFTGSYVVHVTGYDACGFPHTDSVTVIVDALAGPSIECPSVVCAHTNGTYTAVGGCPNAIYSWTVTGGTIVGANNTASIVVNWGNGPIGRSQLR